MDEILGYLSDDRPTLKACSLTCKAMLSSARPLIKSWLFLVSTGNRRSNARFMKSLFKRSKEDSGPFERLVAADCQGSLQYTRHLVIRMGRLPLIPEPLQPYTPYFHRIDNLQTLVIHGPDVSAFVPVFDDYFGMFARSLRCLDIAYILDAERQLLHFISQFPLLEDLSIQSCYVVYSHPGSSPPMPRTSPPFRGRLKLSITMDSQSLCEALAQLPGGLNFTSLELKGCRRPMAVIKACRFTLRSVLFTWTGSLGKCHSISLRIPALTNLPVAGRALDLGDSAVLEKFEFKVDCANLPNTPSWLYRTLWKTKSPVLKEFTISILKCSSPADLCAAMNEGGWRSVDAYLCILAKFQPSFKVVFRVGFGDDEGCVVRNLVEEHFSLASNKGILRIEPISTSRE